MWERNFQSKSSSSPFSDFQSLVPMTSDFDSRNIVVMMTVSLSNANVSTAMTTTRPVISSKQFVHDNAQLSDE